MHPEKGACKNIGPREERGRVTCEWPCVSPPLIPVGIVDMAFGWNDGLPVWLSACQELREAGWGGAVPGNDLQADRRAPHKTHGNKQGRPSHFLLFILLQFSVIAGNGLLAVQPLLTCCVPGITLHAAKGHGTKDLSMEVLVLAGFIHKRHPFSR
eukprot:1138278-Pelagomonas_calceolata.AAC.2